MEVLVRIPSSIFRPNELTLRLFRGHKFQLTDIHLSKEQMETLRGQYDELGSQALEKLQVIFAKQRVHDK